MGRGRRLAEGPSRSGNSFWEDESRNQGVQILQRMGWSVGEALGKNPLNPQDTRRIRVTRRPELLGLGATQDPDQAWKAATSVFNSVLAKLQPVGPDEAEAAMAPADDPQDPGESAGVAIRRVCGRAALYRRFVHAKDASSYSTQHTNEIFGRPVQHQQQDVFDRLTRAARTSRSGLGFRDGGGMADSLQEENISLKTASVPPVEEVGIALIRRVVKSLRQESAAKDWRELYKKTKRELRCRFEDKRLNKAAKKTIKAEVKLQLGA